MNSFESIILRIEDKIATLTINRPKALNAINAQVMNEIGMAFNSLLDQINDLNGVIITGAGAKGFVAGADISEFQGLNAESGSAKSAFGHSVFNSIENFPKPVIAAVNGYCLGGGCELAMACHMRIASENAKFGQPEVNLGLIPGYGGSQRLIDLIGKTKATELLLTGDIIGATEALNLGLVNYVLPLDEIIEKSKKILSKIGTKGPIAIAETIKAINARFDKKQDGYQYEMEAFGRLLATEDAKEGAQAFLEKRKADFKGR